MPGRCCDADAGGHPHHAAFVADQPVLPRLSQARRPSSSSGWTPTTDAWATLNALFHTWSKDGGGTFNAGRYSNPALDTLIDNIRVSDRRAGAMVVTALRLIGDDPSYVPYRRTPSWAMAKKVTAAQWPTIVELRWVKLVTRRAVRRSSTWRSWRRCGRAGSGRRPPGCAGQALGRTVAAPARLCRLDASDSCRERRRHPPRVTDSSRHRAAHAHLPVGEALSRAEVAAVTQAVAHSPGVRRSGCISQYAAGAGRQAFGAAGRVDRGGMHRSPAHLRDAPTRDCIQSSDGGRSSSPLAGRCRRATDALPWMFAAGRQTFSFTLGIRSPGVLDRPSGRAQRCTGCRQCLRCHERQGGWRVLRRWGRSQPNGWRRGHGAGTRQSAPTFRADPAGEASAGTRRMGASEQPRIDADECEPPSVGFTCDEGSPPAKPPDRATPNLRPLDAECAHRFAAVPYEAAWRRFDRRR